MSAKSNFLNVVKTRVLSETAVKHFALFNSQFDNETKEKPFKYPAAFLEFTSIEYRTLSRGVQAADVTARLHIGIKTLRTDDATILELLEDVFNALQGWTPDANIISALSRSFEAQDPNHDGVIVWQQDWTTTLLDTAADTRLKLVKANDVELEVTGETQPPRLGTIQH